jgi:putative ABC transport system substrate-binding protein
MKSRNKLLLILCIAVISSSLLGNAWAATDKIAVIMSKHIIPFNTALKGFKEVVDCPCEIYDIALEEMNKTKTISKIMRNGSPKLILAIGSKALRFAQRNFPHLPIVFTMVTNPSRIVRKRHHITGVRMEIPWETMFEYAKMIAPQHKRVGIILNYKRTEEEVKLVKDLAVKYGLEPVLRAVGNSSEAISEFKNIEDKIEAFLMVPDPYILTPKFYEYILLSSLRYKFVLAGLSPKYTRAGNLFSVMGSNRDWGAQAGSMANKILSGISPGHIPYGFAREYSLSINLKTAKRIGIKISRVTIDKADIIVK